MSEHKNQKQSSRFLDLFEITPDDDRLIVLDGATGTMIQKAGLEKLNHPERHNVLHPDAIRSIHEAYLDAGSDVVYANTFGASPSRFEQEEESFEDVIAAGVSLAKEAVNSRKPQAKVALDVGPLGVLMEPMGSCTFEQAYDEFAAMIRAGAKAGVDLVVIETMSDLQETRAALLAAKENCDLPVVVTMTFEENGRTFSGTSIEAAALTLEGLGADAIGINCSLGPDQLVSLLARMHEWTSLPLVCKPNAGLPDPISGHYHLTDEEFTDAASGLIDAGARALGGCCGTTPSTIEQLAALCETRKPLPCGKASPAISSAREICTCEGICAVGERINPTGKKRMQQALLDQDFDYIARLALEQKEAGADLLDVNVGYPGVDEVDMMPRVISAIESVCDLPLLLDSSNPEALEAGLRHVSGRAAINSVNGSKKSMDAIFPLAAKYGSPVVALCLDEDGIPDSAKGRLDIARRILEEAKRYGISKDRLWFDALTLTVSAQQDQAKESLQAIETFTRDCKAKTILGVSNISFGLPARAVMTQAFLSAALQAGLTFAIINPSSRPLMDTIAAFKVLKGIDEGCRAYVERFANTEQAPAKPAASEDLSLEDAIYKGLPGPAAKAAKTLLQNSVSEMEITQKHLIPALDRTGTDYEQGKLYLPSLLQAANAAQSVFEVIADSLAKSGERKESRGTIVLATVQGDIHDIGKNIVRTLLENYGFTVIDLGRDVAPEKVVETVRNNNVRLVGLSALMTTTLPAMEETIRQLHTLENPPKIMVGGAVLTPEAAKAMKADWYARDARESVRIAEEFFGKQDKQ